jgi:hypothetical protein
MGYTKDRRTSPAPFRGWMTRLHETRAELVGEVSAEAITHAAQISVEAWAAGQGRAGRRRIPRGTLREVFVETIKPAEQACDARAMQPEVIDVAAYEAMETTELEPAS